MKNFLIVLVLLISANCFSQTVDTQGTIKYFNLEGGFYGFVSDDGHHYDLMKLPDEFKTDGTRLYLKGTIRNDMTSAHNWGEIVQIDELTLIKEQIDDSFEMHEWGVMVGCQTNNQYFMTSRPEAITYVKLPVIYFHGNKNRTLNISVDFASGKPTDTYPKAKDCCTKISWNDVKIYPDCPVEKSVREKGNTEFVPLESIMPALNNVDANCIRFNGTQSKFLFYEGETYFDNKLSFTKDEIKKEVTFKNDFEYTIYKVAYTSQQGNFIEPDYVTAVIDSIEAGQSVTVKYSQVEDKYWLNDLMNLGFNTSEAESFWKIWRGTFLSRSNAGGWGNLIYRIPEFKYNEIYKLDISEKPDKIIRAMYVLIHTEM